jgi:hypothetical protein
VAESSKYGVLSPRKQAQLTSEAAKQQLARLRQAQSSAAESEQQAADSDDCVKAA